VNGQGKLICRYFVTVKAESKTNRSIYGTKEEMEVIDHSVMFPSHYSITVSTDVTSN
jgi:hypothetical protein